ncbi:MAG: DUF1028 domain-containing protein [Thermoplasmata archaeon]
MPAPRFGTFSIVAVDRDRTTWGVAVQSKFISVGSVVPWARAGVGAIATQAYANVRYGPEGLALLADPSIGAREVVRRLTEADPRRAERQLGVVDRRGEAAAFTGEKCMDWAGHEVGDGFACQGNILVGPSVVRAMARAFEMTPGDLPEKLLAALSAAQKEGGDRRGMQSAALLLVREKGGYDEGSDRWVDLRVDDHPAPIEELKRIFQLYDLTMLSREDPATLLPIEGELAQRLQHDLGVLGYYLGRRTGAWDETCQAAFVKFLHEHNFETKLRDDRKVWPSIVRYLHELAEAEVARRTRTAPIEPGALERGPGAAAAKTGGGGGGPSPKKGAGGRRSG